MYNMDVHNIAGILLQVNGKGCLNFNNTDSNVNSPKRELITNVEYNRMLIQNAELGRFPVDREDENMAEDTNMLAFFDHIVQVYLFLVYFLLFYLYRHS